MMGARFPLPLDHASVSKAQNLPHHVKRGARFMVGSADLLGAATGVERDEKLIPVNSACGPPFSIERYGGQYSGINAVFRSKHLKLGVLLALTVATYKIPDMK
jgi:hypothetical protein